MHRYHIYKKKEYVIFIEKVVYSINLYGFVVYDRM